MKNQRELTSLIKRISGQANILTIPRIYVDIVGDLETALILSQCIYWSDRTTMRDNWFAHSFDEWLSETSLTKRIVSRCTKTMKELGFIETKLKKFNGAPTVHYRVNLDAIEKAIVTKCHNGLLQNVTMESYETSQSDSDKMSQSLTDTSIDLIIDSEENKSNDVFDAMRDLLMQKIGPIQPIEAEIKAINRMVEIAATEQDIDAAIAFFASNGNTARGAAHILKSVEFNVKRRTQAQNPYAKAENRNLVGL